MTQEPQELEVVSREEAAEGVVAFALARPDGGPLPAWEPGAHIDLHLDPAAPRIRQYSLCGDPADVRTYRIAVLQEREGRGGSLRVHTELHPGTRITVSAPRNLFPLVPAEDYLFIAGGIGVTPILPMVDQAAREGREWRLHYGGRSRRSMAFADTLAAYGPRVHLVPQDESGLLDPEALLDEARPRTAVYCCGPEPLLNAVEEAAAARTPGRLHVERFSPAAAVSQDADHPFDVELTVTGTTVRVDPGVSILDAVARAGVTAYSSCREGTCGTCETFVVGGDVEHRDSILTPEERSESEVMMICVSRCRGERLQLEL